MSAQIIPFHNVKEARKCSFCKTPEANCKTFVASTYTSHCICGVCAKQAKLRLEENKEVV